MGMAAAQLNNAAPQAAFSPMNAQPQVQAKVNNNNMNQVANNNPATTSAAAQAAVAAAAAAVKNNGMFSFPANQQAPNNAVPPTTPGGTNGPTGPLLAPNNMPMAPNGMMLGPKPATVSSVDNDGVNRILTKRKIQELVSQIDPSERLEPEVEDVSTPPFLKEKKSF